MPLQLLDESICCHCCIVDAYRDVAVLAEDRTFGKLMLALLLHLPFEFSIGAVPLLLFSRV